MLIIMSRSCSHYLKITGQTFKKYPHLTNYYHGLARGNDATSFEHVSEKEVLITVVLFRSHLLIDAFAIQVIETRGNVPLPKSWTNDK